MEDGYRGTTTPLSHDDTKVQWDGFFPDGMGNTFVSVMSNATIVLLMVGGPRPFTPDGKKSAIRKEPVGDRVTVTDLGLAGDHHVYRGHGGPEKAILQYPREYYERYRRRFPGFVADIDSPRRGFGENISAAGMTEETVCIGDRYRIGAGDGITVEVAGFRQPCWALGYNSGVRELPRIMQDDGTPGWFYRVLTTGTIAAGDTIALMERPHPEWPLGEFTRRFYGTPLDRTFLQETLTLGPLAENLKAIIRERLRMGVVEEWDRRLYG